MVDSLEKRAIFDSNANMSSVLRCSMKQLHQNAKETNSVPIALNFGGLLLKIVFCIDGELHLQAFRPSQLTECSRFLEKLLETHGDVQFYLPSANRAANVHILTKMLHIDAGNIEFYDELACTHRGLAFLLDRVEESAFTFETEQKSAQREFSMMLKPGHFVPVSMQQTAEASVADSSHYPLIALLIEDYVTAMRIESAERYTIVGRSELGGATFCGLGSQLTGARSFDELLKFAASGDHRRVDMLVEDIYGTAYASVGLPGDLIASSFGKARRCVPSTKLESASQTDSSTSVEIPKQSDVCNPDPVAITASNTSLTSSVSVSDVDTGAFTSRGCLASVSTCRQEDVAKSLVVMYAAYLAQLVSLYAAFPADASTNDKAKSKVIRIIFAGSSVQMRKDIAYALTEMLRFWTNARYDAVFLRHEAFAAPLGHLINVCGLIEDKSNPRWISTPIEADSFGQNS